MEHNKVVESNWLEKYLSHELSEKEETLLEEHLLYCDACVSELEGLKMSIKAIEHRNTTESPQIINIHTDSRLRSPLHYIFRIAALFVVVLGLGVLLFYILQKPNLDNQPLATETNQHQLNEIKADSLNQKKIVKKNSKAIAEIYSANPLYENEIQNTYRSSTLTSISPSNTLVIGFKRPVLFQWVNTSEDSITIAVITNKGEEIAHKKVLSQFRLTTQLKPGLYYWQLQSATEILYTGKFMVKSF
jgi:hypothetical protein